MSTHVGVNDFTEQPAKRRWRSTTGWSRVRIWKGATSKLEAFLATLPAGYSSIDLDDSHDGYTLVSVDYAVEEGAGSGAGTPADPISRTWALRGSEEEVSLWALPKVQAVLRTKTSEEIAQLRADFDARLEGELGMSFADEVIEELFQRIAGGVESVRVKRYVLQKVETVTNTSQLTASHTNVNRIHTYSQLTASEPTLPDAILLVPADLTSYFWLKSTPTVEPVNRGQWQITQEYEAFEDYDSWIYEPAQ